MSASRPPLPDSYEGLRSRAQFALQNGDEEGAIALYRRLAERLARLSDRVLARRPDLSDLHRQTRMELSSLLRAEGRYAEAMEVVEVLLETHPDEARFWRTDLAILRIAKGETETGLVELRTLAEEQPEAPEGWFVLGAETRVEGRFAESEAALERALATAAGEKTGAQADIHYQRFLLYKDMGRLDDAVGAWEEALGQNPDMAQSIRQVYTMLTDAGRYGEAQRYVDRDENELQAGFQRGILATLTGTPGEARQAWQAVAALDPGDFEYGQDCWVEAVLRLGDPEPALIWLQDNLSEVGTPRLFVLSGIAWAMRQDQEVAGALFQQAISLERWGRSHKQKLDSADWRLLDSLVQDADVKKALKSYFAVVETLWG